MENLVLATALKSRHDFAVLQQHLNPQRWSREFQIVFGFVGQYYARDGDAHYVDRNVLAEIIAGSVSNDKHVEKFINYVDEAIALDVSSANIKEAVLLAKREEVAQALALAIANNKDHSDLLVEYNSILATESLEATDDSGIETYTADDMEALLLADAQRDGVIPIYPKSLGERLGGGMQGSDAMIVIARPELGKTALILTMACGAAKQGHKVMVFNNEERISRLYLRAVSNMSGMTSMEVRQDIYTAKEIAMEKGFGNIIFKSMSPGSPKQIEAELDRHSDDDVKLIVVDQLRNLNVKADTKTNQLEEAAKSIRNIGKSRDIATVSVTQAGDSAQNKSILDIGDVDSSNTGIPGACDVLLGIGATEMQKEQGVRTLTPIKNKLTGDHEPFPVRINPQLSKYISASGV